jgi:hypothetical protein
MCQRSRQSQRIGLPRLLPAYCQRSRSQRSDLGRSSQALPRDLADPPSSCPLSGIWPAPSSRPFANKLPGWRQSFADSAIPFSPLQQRLHRETPVPGFRPCPMARKPEEVSGRERQAYGSTLAHHRFRRRAEDGVRGIGSLADRESIGASWVSPDVEAVTGRAGTSYSDSVRAVLAG